MTAPRICKLVCNRNANNIGIGQARPRLSWRYEHPTSPVENWEQEEYELRFDRAKSNNTYRIASAENVGVAWPGDEPALVSREKMTLCVRAKGTDGVWTRWFEEPVEAALLDDEWTAEFVGSTAPFLSSKSKRPIYTRTSFDLDGRALERIKQKGARIYATALGAYQLEINGTPVADHILAPLWQSYDHNLHYQTYAVETQLFKVGTNVIGAVVGEGWYAGHLTWVPHLRNSWGEEIAVCVQLELPGKQVISNGDWTWSYGPILSSEIYDGEEFDANLIDPLWSSEGSRADWQPVKIIKPKSSTRLIAAEEPPIRRHHEFKPVEILTVPINTSPTPKKIVDFGQNLCGWVRIAALPAKDPKSDCHTVTLRFAEVLENGEIATKPLRDAKCTDTIHLGTHESGPWEPTFTTHGFRYVEVSGAEIDLNSFTSIAVYSDLEQIGDFTCSHELVNKLHHNVKWSLRSNFVGLAQDCPQRDERLGWTGDSSSFLPTACFLYQIDGFFSSWLHDLSTEQLLDNNGIVPLYSPDPRTGTFPHDEPHAVWGDTIIMAPHNLHHAYRDTLILEEIYKSMTVWLDKGIPRQSNRLWKPCFQFADWLDPRAPPDNPAAAMTDPMLVANAYLIAVTGRVSAIAKLLGKVEDSDRYAKDRNRLRTLFRSEYITQTGRLTSDSQSAILLAIQFNLLDDGQLPHAVSRLQQLIVDNKYTISTGFVGTPVILDILAEHGLIDTAYRMLEQTTCPSWLYPVTMGATSIWERWDSMMPDGTVNVGSMTSFNHFCLGSVAHFLHTVVAGISPIEPGWKTIKVQPQPGGSLKSATAWHMSPYGRISINWALNDDQLTVKLEVPPNTSARVMLGSKDVRVGSGVYEWTVVWGKGTI